MKSSKLIPAIHRIAEVRRLQKSYFASRDPRVFEQMRAAESALRPLLDGAKTTDPDQWHAVETARAMLRAQAAWIEAQAFTRSTDIASPHYATSQALAIRLQGEAQAYERRCDAAIAAILRPTLPGVE